MEKRRTLAEIAKEMEDMPQDEDMHKAADGLLVEALKLIANLGSLSASRAYLDRLVGAWEKLPKWYE